MVRKRRKAERSQIYDTARVTVGGSEVTFERVLKDLTWSDRNSRFIRSTEPHEDLMYTCAIFVTKTAFTGIKIKDSNKIMLLLLCWFCHHLTRSTLFAFSTNRFLKNVNEADSR